MAFDRNGGRVAFTKSSRPQRTMEENDRESERVLRETVQESVRICRERGLTYVSSFVNGKEVDEEGVLEGQTQLHLYCRETAEPRGWEPRGPVFTDTDATLPVSILWSICVREPGAGPWGGYPDIRWYEVTREQFDELREKYGLRHVSTSAVEGAEGSMQGAAPMVAVMPATPEDAEAIVRIQAETWLATYPDEAHGIAREDIEAMRLGSPRRVEGWRASITEGDERERVFVAKEAGRVVGYCSVKRGETEGYVRMLYVDPARQRKGIGRALATAASAWLGPDRPIALGVAAYNGKAIVFYERLGFRASDEPPEPGPALPSGKAIPLVKMVRPAQR